MQPLPTLQFSHQVWVINKKYHRKKKEEEKKCKYFMPKLELIATSNITFIKFAIIKEF